MKTEQIILLAGLGLGAYYLYTKQRAQTVSTAGQSAYAQRMGFPPNYTGGYQTQSQREASQSLAAGSLIVQGIGAVQNLFGGLFGGGTSAPAQQTAPVVQVDNSDSYAINPAGQYEAWA